MSDNEFGISMLWGEEACHAGKGEKGYTEKRYSFKSEEELEAFLLGINEANGWFEYEIKGEVDE